MFGGEKTNSLKRFIVVAVGAAIALAATIAAHWYWTQPQLYKSCAAPNGNWSVAVFRSHGLFGTPVTVRVHARNGDVVFEDVIDALDLWSDVEYFYSDLVCEPGSARLGPRYRYWKGSGSGWFDVPVPTS